MATMFMIDSDLCMSIENSGSTIGNSKGKQCQKFSISGSVWPHGSSIAMYDTDDQIDDDNISFVFVCPSGNVDTMKPKNIKRWKLGTFVVGCDTKAKQDTFEKLNNDCLKKFKNDSSKMKIMNVLGIVMIALLFSSSNDYNDNDAIIEKEDFMKNCCYDSFQITALTKSCWAHGLQDSRVEKSLKNHLKKMNHTDLI